MLPCSEEARKESPGPTRYPMVSFYHINENQNRKFSFFQTASLLIGSEVGTDLSFLGGPPGAQTEVQRIKEDKESAVRPGADPASALLSGPADSVLGPRAQCNGRQVLATGAC